MLRIAIVTNTPPPYRIPVFKKLGQLPDIDLQVIFCAEREPNRLWDLPPLEFNHLFLRERFITVNGRYIHNNPDVISALRKFAPDVVVSDGFNPTNLYAFGYTVFKNIPHVPMTDGTDLSEKNLSRLHRIVRRVICARSKAFIAASNGGQRLYESYGVASHQCFKSCLCIDNQAFSPQNQVLEKRYDFIFCGRIEPVKNPQFALEVASLTAERLQRPVTILFVGNGSEELALKEAVLQRDDRIKATFYGFAAQRDLPALYQSSRLFLFPSLWDPWGVVANEACAAGLPVLVSPHAGVAGELVLNGQNGFVCDLNATRWAEHAAWLLQHEDKWQAFSKRSLALANDFTFDKAASGILSACRFALLHHAPGKIKRTV